MQTGKRLQVMSWLPFTKCWYVHGKKGLLTVGVIQEPFPYRSIIFQPGKAAVAYSSNISPLSGRNDEEVTHQTLCLLENVTFGRLPIVHLALLIHASFEVPFLKLSSSNWISYLLMNV